MSALTPPSDFRLTHCVDCAATLTRLLGNLSGFAYRRRHDARWTMDFISAGVRDVTGYDPHRFVANASLAFGDLIARADRARVEECVARAVAHRHRAIVEYRLRTAHGAWTLVEDRFAPVFNATGQLLAIEGIIDRARRPLPSAWPRARRRSPTGGPDTALLPLQTEPV